MLALTDLLDMHAMLHSIACVIRCTTSFIYIYILCDGVWWCGAGM